MKAKITVRIEFQETLHPVVFEADVAHMSQFDDLMSLVGQTLQRSRRMVRNIVEHANDDQEPARQPHPVFEPASMQEHINRLQLHTARSETN